ncbi:hypothetical protein ABW19_dt0201068 [Dactylella cylindrospora]|nr:hypothetical protein ABW19_dt0201068 [Dactylella cylindrospora]
MAIFRTQTVAWGRRIPRQSTILGLAPPWLPRDSTAIARVLSLPIARAYSGVTQTVTIPHIPELYNPNFLDLLLPPPPPPSPQANLNAPSTPPPTNPLLSALKDTTNRVLTENFAPAYRSTNNPVLDAFHRPQQTVGLEALDALFTPAWELDPETTLRIIFYLRSIHEGKSNKRLFYRAWGWLYKHHPRTAIYNLKSIVEPKIARSQRPGGEGDLKELAGLSHGYWKDLLNILALAVRGRLGEHDHYNYGNGMRQWQRVVITVRGDEHPIPKDMRDYKKLRLAVAKSRYEDLERKLEEDPKFRALYVTVARLFADRLVEDMRLLRKYESIDDPKEKLDLRWEISLAGKWAPTPGRSHDRLTNISTAIAQLIHAGRKDHPWEYPSTTTNLSSDRKATKEECDILRSYLQRWFLSPLRDIHDVPERYMSAGEWSKIRFDRVPAVCMQSNSQKFYNHDYSRFSRYIFDVQRGRKTVAGATLLPHEILMRLMEYDADLQALKIREKHLNPEKYPDVAEIHRMRREFTNGQISLATSQWRTLVDRLRESGSIENSLAICDVSGSMGMLCEWKDRRNPPPLFSALAMSLLLASISKPPMNSGFITFSESPEFLRLDGSLIDMMNFMVKSDWGMNTDLKKVFTGLILPLAKKNNIKQEDMIKRLFIFTDMQFDHGGADTAAWDTNYDEIVKEYEAAGYEMPEIVYWDLGKYDTVEVQANRKGVAMMKGFSAAMMKVFMGEDEGEATSAAGSDEGRVKEKKENDEFTPLNVMKKALMRPSFDGLVVLD